jgi:hypothetical protein
MKRVALVGVVIAGFAAPVFADKPADKPAAEANPNMKMEDCGAMMKSVIPLPTKFAELMTAVADGMDGHAAWVGASKDKNAKAEAAAMKKLAKDHRDVAKQMAKIVADMEAGGKLGPAPHDMSKMDPKMAESGMKQIALEREMAALMTKHADETEKMMKDMAGGGHAGHGAPAAAPAAPAAPAKK